MRVLMGEVTSFSEIDVTRVLAPALPQCVEFLRSGSLFRVRHQWLAQTSVLPQGWFVHWCSGLRRLVILRSLPSLWVPL